MPDFPKPPQKRTTFSLPSKSAVVVAQMQEREKALKQRAEELAEFEKQLHAQKEELEAQHAELENKKRMLAESELLFKNQKLLYQKQFAQLMEQNELADLRKELDRKQEDLAQKEAFLAQTEKRLNEQISAREQDLAKREAWVSAEHEKATLRNARRLRAIVFTDVVSYSALMQADESRTIQKVRADLQRMQAEGKEQGGMLINTMGDGMLMIFPSAIQAVRFSLATQRVFNSGEHLDGLRHRFGIHIADVALLPDGGIAGDGVNVASRLESKAPAGGICISAVVHALVKGKLHLPPGDLESIQLKNIAEPVAVYKYAPEVILAMDDPSRSAPPDFVSEDEERSSHPFPAETTEKSS
jgi:class 3 adenylate cyclase